MKRVERILAPTDFSPSARLAVERAAELAAQLGARVDLLTVNSRSYIRQAIRDGLLCATDTDETLRIRVNELTQHRLAELISTLGSTPVKIETHIRTGEAGTEILHFAEDNDIDLIVLGKYGIGGVRNILSGSAAEKVIRKAKCPVMLVN